MKRNEASGLFFDAVNLRTKYNNHLSLLPILFSDERDRHGDF